MTSSFVKIMFSLISKVPVFFSGSRECAYSNLRTVNCEKRIYHMNTTTRDGILSFKKQPNVIVSDISRQVNSFVASFENV